MLGKLGIDIHVHTHVHNREGENNWTQTLLQGCRLTTGLSGDVIMQEHVSVQAWRACEEGVNAVTVSTSYRFEINQHLTRTTCMYAHTHSHDTLHFTFCAACTGFIITPFEPASVQNNRVQCIGLACYLATYLSSSYFIAK